jgi:hypothetical protein
MLAVLISASPNGVDVLGIIAAVLFVLAAGLGILGRVGAHIALGLIALGLAALAVAVVLL